MQHPALPVFPACEFLPDYRDLSLAQQVGQMVIVRASGYLFDDQIRYPQWEPSYQVLQCWLQEGFVGGVLLLGGSAPEIALRTQQLQALAPLPLLLCADVEEGIGQRFSGATWFPPPFSLGLIARQDLSLAQIYAQQMGLLTAAEAQAIGLNWLLAPVVDVNNNPANPVINIRAFGETPDTVASLTTAFIRGVQHYGVLTTAKHFPGHGDTTIDSHLELPVLPHTPERLASLELVPFRHCIAAGVDAVMSAHVQIPAWDAQHPATLSAPILTGQLRQKLGFSGLIVTDALVMGAIGDRYDPAEAAILAVEAGADLLVMPPDPLQAIQAICAAVKAGRLDRQAILASVARIWRAKFKVLGLSMETGQALVNAILPRPAGAEALGYRDWIALTSRLLQPATTQVAAQILRHSLLRHPQVRPLPRFSATQDAPSPRNLIIVDNLLDCKFLGMHTPAIAVPRKAGYVLQWVDSYVPHQADPESNQPTLLQIFMRGNPFRGSANLSQVAQLWFEQLRAAGQLLAVAIYGSPYLLQQFQLGPDSPIPYVVTCGATPQAQAIVLQQFFP